jgi:hypothetical protein
MDPALKSLLTQTIHVRRPTGFSPGGTPTLAAAVAMLAYLEPGATQGSGMGGTEMRTGTLIITETDIGMDDRIWMPGDDPTDLTLAETPLPGSRRVFNEPFLGTAVDHYEIMV